MSNHSKKNLVCKNILTGIGDYLAIGIVSSLAGALVAFPFILINKAALSVELLKAAAVGFSIGVAARFVFSLVFRIIHKNPFWAFFSVFIIIGAGTLGGSWFLGMDVALQLGIITFVAEVVGLSLCAILYRYSNKLNESLRKKQNLIESGKESD